MMKLAFTAAALALVRSQESTVEDWSDYDALSLLQVRATKSDVNETLMFNDGDTPIARNKKCNRQIVRFRWQDEAKSFDDCRAECLMLPNCRVFGHWTEPAGECRLYSRCRSNTREPIRRGNRNTLYRIARAPEEPTEEEEIIEEVDPEPAPQIEPRPFVPPTRPDTASAVDDPHITTYTGHKFDLKSEAHHTATHLDQIHTATHLDQIHKSKHH